ncbi:hypothetical protein M0R45_017609 [Rubus argutus]|uniref:Endonuclease/exonuclease/phosphatase domain-containing protein n=1 Tax=Rubus argutus TaxID=59490 RepID=A0AAW1XYV4_RUBAR
MKILYWNARGIANGDTRRALKNLVSSHKPTPNLWLLCNDALMLSVISKSAQQITFSYSIDGVHCVITAVYAKTSVVGRRQLWQDLVNIRSQHVQGPWAVIGDFNCVLGAHEKKGWWPSSCFLLRTEVRLDRALGNLACLPAKLPFRFQSLWLQIPDFNNLVRHSWSSFQFYGCPQFVLASKLRALKLILRD